MSEQTDEYAINMINYTNNDYHDKFVKLGASVKGKKTIYDKIVELSAV